MKIILIIAAFAFTLIHAETFTINGKITDEENGEPLSGVTVRLEKSSFGTYSAGNGNFILKGIPQGNYKLKASMIGYKTSERDISLDRDITLNISLAEKALSTSEIVVSANKRVQAVQEVPISISVVEFSDMTNRNITRLNEALRYVSGVEVNQDNVSIRGSSGFSFGIGSRALLLVDGFPLLSGDNGDIELDAIPLYNIERVEIVKGAGSALYGTSALGGVVNIITKAPKEKPRLDARILSGIYTEPKYDGWKVKNTPRFNSKFDLNYAEKFNNVGISLGGSFVDDQSYREYDDENIYSLNGKFDYSFNDYTSINLNTDIMFKNRTDWVYWNSLDSATFPPTATNRGIRIKTNSYSLYGKAEHIFNKNHFAVIKAGILSSEFYNTYDSDHEEYRQSLANNTNIEVQMNSNLSQSNLLTYGLNYSNSTVTSSTYGDHDQQIFSAYSQLENNSFENTILNAGVRFDLEKADSLDNSLQMSPKAGLTYKLSEGINLRASTGAGFRAPSVAERYASVSFQGFDVIPNPDLKPERSFSFETGISIEKIIGSLPVSIDFSVFDNEMYDLIEPGFIEGSARIQFQNLTRARIAGTELMIRTILPGDAGLKTSFTFMNPRNTDTDQILKYRSRFLFNASFNIPYKWLSLQTDFRYKSKVENIDTRLGLQIADHDARVPVKIIDATLSADLSKLTGQPFKFSLTGKNLLDYYYTEVPGNLAPVRFIGIQLEFHGM